MVFLVRAFQSTVDERYSDVLCGPGGDVRHVFRLFAGRDRNVAQCDVDMYGNADFGVHRHQFRECDCTAMCVFGMCVILGNNLF